jgi:superfamily II DNA or RNA helicase
MNYKFSSKANYVCAQLVDAFEAANINSSKISNWNHYKSAIVKAGKFLNGGKKGEAYNDFTGKIGFPLFIEYLINCEHFTSHLGVHNMISEWDLAGDDHGVDGTVNLVTDANDLCTVQLKFKDNPQTFLDRNKDNAGNFYEASREEYGIESRDRMIWITSSFGKNNNLRDYTRIIDGHLIAKLVESKKKLFFMPFFKAVQEAADAARIQRPQYGVIAKEYTPCQKDMFSAVLSNDHLKIIEAACGSGKGDAIGKKIEETFKEKPGSIVTVKAARLQLLGELSNRFHKDFSSQPYLEASFSSRKDWTKDNVIQGTDANTKTFASTNHTKWVEFLDEQIAPFPHVNLVIFVCYASYESFAKMILSLQENTALWEKIKDRFEVANHDEVHNLTANEKTFEDPDEDRRLNRIIKKWIPFMNSVFKQTIGYSATVPEFIKNHPELFGEVKITINQKTLQEQGVTIPLHPIVIVSDSEDLNSALIEDDKDLTFFIKAINEEIKHCQLTGIVPKIIFWTKSAIITGYFENKIREKYPNVLVGSMTAATPYKQRTEFFNRFSASSEMSVLFNYDIVSEGTDIDGATAVVVGRGLGNIKLTQIAGRPVRLYNVDRTSLREKKIKPLVKDGWVKPEGRIYLYEESDSLSSTESVSDAIKYLQNLNSGGLINIEDAKFLKKPKGNEPRGEPGVMDEPDTPNPEYQKKFYDILRVQEYQTRWKAQIESLNTLDNFFETIENFK